MSPNARLNLTGVTLSPDPTREEEAGLDFYVTVLDSGRTGFLLGPYPTHEEAKAQVERGRELANKADPWAGFYSFGTASLPKGTPRKVVFAA